MVDILNNPAIRAAVQFETQKDRLIADLAEQLISTKTWGTMNTDERWTCLRYIVSQVSTEEELRDRLRSELSLGYVAFEWHLSSPDDETGNEARMLVKSLGGLVTKSGALVMIMTSDGII